MNELKAALWTALFSFVTIFFTSLMGLMSTIMSWASGTADFPGFSVIGKFAAAAAVSALIGLVNGLVRLAQSRLGIGTVPQYGPQYDGPVVDATDGL